MKFCPKCGFARASEIAKFCGQCGFSYEAAGFQVAPAVVVEPVVVPEPVLEISAPSTPAPLPTDDLDERTQFAGRNSSTGFPEISAPATEQPTKALAFGPGFNSDTHCTNCGQPRTAGQKWCELCDKVF